MHTKLNCCKLENQDNGRFMDGMKKTSYTKFLVLLWRIDDNNLHLSGSETFIFPLVNFEIEWFFKFKQKMKLFLEFLCIFMFISVLKAGKVVLLFISRQKYNISNSKYVKFLRNIYLTLFWIKNIHKSSTNSDQPKPAVKPAPINPSAEGLVAAIMHLKPAPGSDNKGGAPPAPATPAPPTPPKTDTKTDTSGRNAPPVTNIGDGNKNTGKENSNNNNNAPKSASNPLDNLVNAFLRRRLWIYRCCDDLIEFPSV